MSEFRVTGVFPVSFRPDPFVVGHAIGDFDVGGAVELRRAGEVIAHGFLRAFEIHRSPKGEFSLTFSDEISQHVRVDDVIHSTNT
ncbi:hypothetical protein AB0G00_23030 [Nocardia salmonicida]|uniref:hypothetical protein n=1 Tax=Nocardia salmonicida TaxID=53431 RepID=UPI0033DA3866